MLQVLQVAGISNLPNSTSQPSSSSAEVNAACDRDVATIAGLSGVTITSSLGGQETLTPNQGGTFHSIAISLGLRVPDKIKHKIWAYQYIDLGLLLSSSKDEPRYSVSVCTDSLHDNGLSKLALEPVHKPKSIASFGQWVSAFNTFVAVYTVSLPASAPALMKYCEIVRTSFISKAIGAVMMNSFDSFANLNRNHFPGIMFIGNSGSSLCLSCQLIILSKLVLLHQRPFQRVSVGNSHVGNFVGAANLNTTVINVPVLTEHWNAPQVIFCTKPQRPCWRQDRHRGLKQGIPYAIRGQ